VQELRRFVLVHVHEAYRTAYHDALAHYQAVAEGEASSWAHACPTPRR
jgi:hypothetical protein